MIPALIAALLYLLLAYAVVPLIRKHRNRYSQYLPLHTISNRTSSLRERISDRFFSFVLPSRRRVVDGSGVNRRGSSADELAFGDEEGESMVGFDVNRREPLVRGGPDGFDSGRRLSRDLEEGFKDDSDEDSVDERRR